MGSLVRERSDGLGTFGSIKASGKDQKFEQGSAQISNLQTRRADNIRERDRPDRRTLSEPISRTHKKTEQNRRKQHKNCEPQAKRRPDTQHRQSDHFEFGNLLQQVGPGGLNSL